MPTIPCDAQSLVSAADCLICGLPIGAQQAIMVSLLCQIANNTGPIPPAKFWTPPSFPLEADLGFTLGVTDLNTFDFEDFGGLTGLLTIAFPMTSSSTVLFLNQTTLTSITGDSITSFSGDLNLEYCQSLETVSFASLVTAGGIIDIENNNVDTINFDSLQTVAGYFQTSFNQISIANFPNLISIGADFNMHDEPNLASISMPNCTTFGLGITTVNDPNLETLDVSGALTLASGFSCNNCPSLSTVSIGNMIIADGFIINFDGDALDGDSVNAILRRCVVSNLQNSDIELGNGTNAAPTGQGLIDKATLLTSPGNTVNTN